MKPTIIKVILALVVSKGWLLMKVDVNNAFLNGELFEDIFMIQPHSFNKYVGLVFKLHKPLHGLKQVHRAWFSKLSLCLLGFEFLTIKSDSSLFV